MSDNITKDKIEDAEILNTEEKIEELFGEDKKIKVESASEVRKPIATDEKGQVGDEVILDFKNNNFMNDFVSKKTLKSDAPSATGSNFEETDPEKLREKLKNEEDKYAKQFTVQEFEEIATFLIDLLDTGVSSACKWYAKDTSDTAYSINEKKKRTLIKQLSMILVKYQVKFSIVWLFVFTLVVVFASPVKRAIDNKRNLADRGPGAPIKRDENMSNEDLIDTLSKKMDEAEKKVKEEGKENINTGMAGTNNKEDTNKVKGKSGRPKGNPGKS